MVEVFKTNVQEPETAQQLINVLTSSFPGSRVNFDLQDCDNVLRVEAAIVQAERIIELVYAKGYKAAVL